MKKIVLLTLVVIVILSMATTHSTQAAAQVTLRTLVHQNPPMVAYMEAFNKKFQEKYPDIAVDMSVVNASDLATVTQTRLTANDVDLVDLFAFANGVQPYMKGVDLPAWQQLIDAGLLMDLTDQPFIKNFDSNTVRDATTYKDKVYEINLAKFAYTGIFYNKDLFAANNIKIPTTWKELVAACDTFKKANIPCMTTGGKDGWPIFVGAFGIISSLYPDQQALVKGLWTGDIKWNDAKSMEMWNKMRVYAQEMLEPDASGIAGDAAPGRFASGAVAMFPSGTWYAAAIDAAKPTFKWGYIPFPGSDNADDNKVLYGKYDQGWAVAANTPNKDAAMKYLTEFSAPENYQAWVDAVGAFPTQSTAKLTTNIGKETAGYEFRVGYGDIWVAPKGAGEYANPWASYFKPFGTYDDPKTLADKVQSDLQSGLDAAK